MRGIRLDLPLSILVLGGLAGCDDLPFFRACTDVGCMDVLAVELIGDVPDEFTLTAEAAGEEPQVRECSNQNPCGSTVFFEDFTPNQVTLILQSSAGSTEVTVEPSYSVVRPNGKHCPPKCRQGIAEFTIPATPAH